jgi:hypothetical protein
MSPVAPTCPSLLPIEFEFFTTWTLAGNEDKLGALHCLLRGAVVAARQRNPAALPPGVEPATLAVRSAAPSGRRADSPIRAFPDPRAGRQFLSSASDRAHLEGRGEDRQAQSLGTEARAASACPAGLMQCVFVVTKPAISLHRQCARPVCLGFQRSIWAA